MNFPIDVWSLMALFLVIGVAAWGYRLMKQRLDEQRYREHLAELEFEQSIFSGNSSMDIAGHDMQFVVTPTAGAEPAISQPTTSPVPVETMQSPVQPVSAPGEPQPADQAAAAVMDQLRISGLLRSVEGYVELHGNPKGAAILLLRTGKRALLVPHMESEAFLRRHAKRVDMVLMAGSDGKAVVVRPLEELLSENMIPG